MQGSVEQDDEEFEQLLGEIPSATSGPPPHEEDSIKHQSPAENIFAPKAVNEFYHPKQRSLPLSTAAIAASARCFPASFGTEQSQSGLPGSLPSNGFVADEQTLASAFAKFNLKDNTLKQGIGGSNLLNGASAFSPIDASARLVGSLNSNGFSMDKPCSATHGFSSPHSHSQRNSNEHLSGNHVAMISDGFRGNSCWLEQAHALDNAVKLYPGQLAPFTEVHNFQTMPRPSITGPDIVTAMPGLPYQFYRNSQFAPYMSSYPQQCGTPISSFQSPADRIQLMWQQVEEDRYRTINHQYLLSQAVQSRPVVGGGCLNQNGSHLTQNVRYQSVYPCVSVSQSEKPMYEYGQEVSEAKRNGYTVNAGGRSFTNEFCSKRGNQPFSKSHGPATFNGQNYGAGKISTKKSAKLINSNELAKPIFPEKILTRSSSKGVSTIKTLHPASTDGCGHAFSNANGKNAAFSDRSKSLPLLTGPSQVDNKSHPKELPSETIKYDACFKEVREMKYNSLEEVEGRIYFIARDQHGCRFLQKKFDEGNPEDVHKIFVEIIDHIIELMTDPFGNYLVQKLLEVCSGNERLQILHAITQRPGELVKISLNMHGTRAVQKLIETLETPEQVSMIVSSLKPGVVTLIKDLNGNHVVQRCLQCLFNQDAEFLFDAAAVHCVEIATHRHGCCVLQRCIDYSTGTQRQRLVAEIAANSLVLSQDPFGNYVVQYILDLGIVWATEEVMRPLEGNFTNLSMQKFSSNVVEKCLKLATEDKRVCIIQELMNSPQLGQLLQDPFANYVIQSALSASKGWLHAAFVEAIRPHFSVLRSSPFGRRILSRTNRKK